MKKRTIPTRASFADTYDQYRHGYSQAAIEHIKKRAGFAPSFVVLDLACGTGLVLRAFLDEARSVYGLDLSSTMLNRAYRKYGRTERPAHIVRGDGEASPFPANTFDLVTIGQAIHWFDLERLVPELRRLLKPDGWVAILSKYPSPREPYRPLYEYVLSRFAPADRPDRYRATTAVGVGNVFGLERGGFSDYRRAVFEHKVSYPVETYLRGCAAGPDVQKLGQDSGALFLAELERVLRASATDGIITELFLEYVISARYTP